MRAIFANQNVSESAISRSQNVRKGVTAIYEYIWANLVLRTNHMTFLTNRFSKLNSLPTSTIFVSGTSGVTAILKYQSVSPIGCLDHGFII